MDNNEQATKQCNLQHPEKLCMALYKMIKGHPDLLSAHFYIFTA